MLKTGDKQVFFYHNEDGDAASLLPYNGKLCTVRVESTRNRDDQLNGGLWDVEFEDGFEPFVFGCELESVSNCRHLPKADIYILESRKPDGTKLTEEQAFYLRQFAALQFHSKAVVFFIAKILIYVKIYTVYVLGRKLQK